jgi:hypothetical protein
MPQTSLWHHNKWVISMGGWDYFPASKCSWSLLQTLQRPWQPYYTTDQNHLLVLHYSNGVAFSLGWYIYSHCEAWFPHKDCMYTAQVSWSPLSWRCAYLLMVTAILRCFLPLYWPQDRTWEGSTLPVGVENPLLLYFCLHLLRLISHTFAVE